MNQKRSRQTRERPKRSLIGSRYPSSWALVQALSDHQVEGEDLTQKDICQVARTLRFEGWRWNDIGDLCGFSGTKVRECFHRCKWLC